MRLALGATGFLSETENDISHPALPGKEAILRHSNVSVTLGYYVKTGSPDVLAGMNEFEDAAQIVEKSAVSAAWDTYGTPKPDSDAMSGFVN